MQGCAGLFCGERAKKGGNRMRTQTWKTTRIAMLSAAAFVLYLLEIPLPVVTFYKLDFSTVAALLAGFSMGPLAGFLVVLIKNLLHMTVSSTAGMFYIGEIADLCMSSAFVVPASILYARDKRLRTALVGMGIGILSMAVLGVLLNYYLMIPVFIQFNPYVTEEGVVDLGKKLFAWAGFIKIDSLVDFVAYVTAPFNVIKGLLLSVVTALLYKRLSPLLHQRP